VKYKYGSHGERSEPWSFGCKQSPRLAMFSVATGFYYIQISASERGKTIIYLIVDPR